jgi:hypothetical protein
MLVPPPIDISGRDVAAGAVIDAKHIIAHDSPAAMFKSELDVRQLCAEVDPSVPRNLRVHPVTVCA